MNTQYTKTPDKCTHEKTTMEWISKTCDMYGHEISHWEHYTVSTTIDLDIRRYQCTQCGMIGYY